MARLSRERLERELEYAKQDVESQRQVAEKYRERLWKLEDSVYVLLGLSPSEVNALADLQKGKSQTDKLLAMLPAVESIRKALGTDREEGDGDAY